MSSATKDGQHWFEDVSIKTYINPVVINVTVCWKRRPKHALHKDWRGGGEERMERWGRGIMGGGFSRIIGPPRDVIRSRDLGERRCHVTLAGVY
jgi:hypothetical protein